jgi:hypothetical protein
MKIFNLFRKKSAPKTTYQLRLMQILSTNNDIGYVTRILGYREYMVSLGYDTEESARLTLLEFFDN